MKFNCASINQFIASITKLCNLNEDNILDDDMLEACIKTAAQKALKEYNDEIHFVLLTAEDTKLPYELNPKGCMTFANEKSRPGATNTETGQ